MNDGLIRNGWYQGAWSEEIAPAGMLARTLLGEALVLARGADGEAFALADSCPHRFVPLSRGKFDGQNIACAYHGLQFDKSGECVHSPQGAVAQGTKAGRFPLAERQGRLWIWFGDPDQADPSRVPHLAGIDSIPASARRHATMHLDCGWQLLIDNLMDLSHSDFVHPAFGDFVSHAQMTVNDDGNGVTARWNATDVSTPIIHKRFIDADRVDTWVQSQWQMPSAISVEASATPVGQPTDRALWSLHAITPESTEKSYYFYEFSRNFDVADEELSDFMSSMGAQAFEREDRPILELQQVALGKRDVFERKPLVLAGDRAAVLVRRKLSQLDRMASGSAEDV
ncbi:MAG: hypothetical protein RL481_122 [Pseudomonadota bacterium]|jgi:vanillate O-demethylase monooxygenase subunit